MSDARHLLARTPGETGGQVRMTRARKAEATRRSLIDAAASVVGADGYANASVAKITALADVAQGTFYNYFSSQQDLFDHLLPELGAELLDFIRERVAGETDSFRREEIGFRAFFEFVRARPEFYRILNEAETFSPKAFEGHMRNMAAGYLRALRTAAAKGEIAEFADRDLEVVVYTLLAARNYLWFRYMRHEHSDGPLPEWVVAAYMNLLERGIRPASKRSKIRPPKSAAAALAAPPIEERLRMDATDSAQHLVILPGDRDRDGKISRRALLALVEAAGQRLAGEGGELLSLNTTFLRSSAAARLTATSTIEASEAHCAATITIHEPGACHAVASAHALYCRPLGVLGSPLTRRVPARRR